MHFCICCKVWTIKDRYRLGDDIERTPQRKQVKPYETVRQRADNQELYCLYYVEGHPQEEIVEMKDVSQNTISKKLRRIKKQLTEMCRSAV